MTLPRNDSSSSGKQLGRLGSNFANVFPTSAWYRGPKRYPVTLSLSAFALTRHKAAEGARSVCLGLTSLHGIGERRILT